MLRLQSALPTLLLGAINQNKSEINGYGKEIIVWRVSVNFSLFKHYCEDPRFSHLFVI